MAKRLTSILLILCIASLPAPEARGAIIQKIDFEDGLSVQQSDKVDSHGNSADIVRAERGVTPRSGEWMQRTYLNRNTSAVTYRTESKVLLDAKRFEFKKGEEYWVGLSVFIPADWNMNYGNNYSNGIVWQFHDYHWLDSTWRSTLPLTAMHSSSGWIIRNHSWLRGNDAGNYTGFSKTVPYRLGAWNDFVMNVKFSGNISPNDENGFLKVWVNGEKVLDRVGQNYFGEQTMGPYMHFGLYNWGWRLEHKDNWVGPFERMLWHDEVRIGDASSSYAEVVPGGGTVAPRPPSLLSVN